MRERPILFSSPMVRALLAGAKTQTRRIVKSEHADDAEIWKYFEERGMWESGIGTGAPGSYGHGEYVRCPYGAPGDRLWVRESFAYSVRDPDAFNEGHSEDTHHAVYRATQEHEGEWTHYDDEGKQTRCEPEWRPSIHMPRWASRITLEVTSVRVERLHAISVEDAYAEGFDRATWDSSIVVDMYRQLWIEINGAESWAANPWVWVVEFKRAQISEAA